MNVLDHTEFTVDFLRPFTATDSIKTTGSLISCYITIENSLENSFDIESLRKGGIRASTVFPMLNSEKLYPISKINTILRGTKDSDREQILENRKKIPRFLPIGIIEKIAVNLKDNGYSGVSAGMVPDLVKYETADISYEDDRMSVNLSDPENPALYTREFNSFSGLSFESGKISGMKCWFSTSLSENVDPEKFLASVRLLEEFGLSGRRTTGSGQFIMDKYEKPGDKVYEYSGEGLYLMLSKYIPSEADMNSVVLSKSMYSVSNFSGSDSTGISMGSYRCFNEGSILYLKGDVTGRSYDVGKNRFLPFFPVLRRIS